MHIHYDIMFIIALVLTCIDFCEYDRGSQTENSKTPGYREIIVRFLFVNIIKADWYVYLPARLSNAAVTASIPQLSLFQSNPKT